MVNIYDEMNIMHPIPQTDNSHEDVDYTGHIVKETCNANINSHENQDVNDDSAGGSAVSNYSKIDVIKDTKTFEFLTNA